MRIAISRRQRLLGTALGALALGLGTAPFAAAQIKGMPGLDATRPLGEGPAPAAAPADGDLRPPSFTDAQMERGRRGYLSHCADCHGSELDNGEFGGAPLRGSYFDSHWGGLSVDALYGFISSAMPPNRPGSLSPQVYTDITAFILAKNGFEPSGAEMPASMEAMAGMGLGRD